MLFETTLMGPQLLRDAYGPDSVQLKTLIQIVTNMIADLRTKLQAEYEDRVLVQVSFGRGREAPGAPLATMHDNPCH